MDGLHGRRAGALVLIGLIHVAVLAAQGPSGSDLKLEGAALRRFLATKGRALLGRDVHWHVPAGRLRRPLAARGSQLLFAAGGVGILIPKGATALAEVRRRGGVACLRGRVVRLRRPEGKARRSGTPRRGNRRGEADPEPGKGVRGRRKTDGKPGSGTQSKPRLPEFAILVRDLSRRRR